MNKTGQLRIIGGEWRGRKLAIAGLPELRPTKDFIRETLFNWLAPWLPGAFCLDAFAGSGALGFEALSRGASKAVLVDRSDIAVRYLIQAADQLQARSAEIYQAIVPHQLKKPDRPFDIVFLDPPFQGTTLLDTCFYLEENFFLAERAHVYLESDRPIQVSELPAHWQILKTKQTGQVAYHLIMRSKRC